MSILVCPLSKVEEMIDAHVPERIVSVLDPGSTFPDSGLTYQGRHLRLSFHDLHEPVEGQVMPSTRDIDRLLEFLAGWPRTRPILAHCRAGVGRSPATAYIAACFGDCQASCRMIATNQATSSSTVMPRTRDGLSSTVVMGDQSRDWPVQRSGCLLRARS